MRADRQIDQELKKSESFSDSSTFNNIPENDRPTWLDYLMVAINRIGGDGFIQYRAFHQMQAAQGRAIFGQRMEGFWIGWIWDTREINL